MGLSHGQHLLPPHCSGRAGGTQDSRSDTNSICDLMKHPTHISKVFSHAQGSSERHLRGPVPEPERRRCSAHRTRPHSHTSPPSHGLRRKRHLLALLTRGSRAALPPWSKRCGVAIRAASMGAVSAVMGPGARLQGLLLWHLLQRRRWTWGWQTGAQVFSGVIPGCGLLPGCPPLVSGI